MADAELPVHRVPITVFVEVAAVDYSDGRSIAEIAVRQTLAGAVRGVLPTQIVCTTYRDGQHVEAPVTVHAVMETGTAAGNGYLWTKASDRAYRERN